MKAASILRAASSFVPRETLDKTVDDFVPWEDVAKFEGGLKRGSALQRVVYWARTKMEPNRIATSYSKGIGSPMQNSKNVWRGNCSSWKMTELLYCRNRIVASGRIELHTMQRKSRNTAFLNNLSIVLFALEGPLQKHPTWTLLNSIRLPPRRLYGWCISFVEIRNNSPTSFTTSNNSRNNTIKQFSRYTQLLKCTILLDFIIHFRFNGELESSCQKNSADPQQEWISWPTTIMSNFFLLILFYFLFKLFVFVLEFLF